MSKELKPCPDAVEALAAALKSVVESDLPDDCPSEKVAELVIEHLSTRSSFTITRQPAKIKIEGFDVPTQIWLQLGYGDEGGHTWCSHPTGQEPEIGPYVLKKKPAMSDAELEREAYEIADAVSKASCKGQISASTLRNSITALAKKYRG